MTDTVFLPWVSNEDEDEYPQYLDQNILYAPFTLGKILIELLQLLAFVYSTDLI